MIHRRYTPYCCSSFAVVAAIAGAVVALGDGCSFAAVGHDVVAVIVVVVAAAAGQACDAWGTVEGRLLWPPSSSPPPPSPAAWPPVLACPSRTEI